MADVHPLFEIEVQPVVKGSRDNSRLLYQQIKTAILDGRLRHGTQLPPTRQSDVVFGASRNTLANVYARLISDGLAKGRQGSGTYVAEQIRTRRPRRSSAIIARDDHRLNSFWLRPDVTTALNFWREPAMRDCPHMPTLARADFRPAAIDSTLFPFDALRTATAKQLRGLEKRPTGRRSPQGNQGSRYLRDAITNHIAITRAVVCQAEDIVVTSGAQQAFDLLARVLVTPHKTVVAVEDPGYPPMRVAFAAAGAKIVPIEVDAEGLRVDALGNHVNIICICPSHHFPLGLTMSKQRRLDLIQYARDHDAIIIEDDYDGEFRFEGHSLEALRMPHHSDVVFYVGTFSKCMLPALRLGFIVAPDWAIPSLIAAKNCLDWHCATLLQSAVAQFITEGHLLRHVRRMRKIYTGRRQLLLGSLRSDFGRWLQPIPSFYGMHVTASACAPLDLEGIAKIAQSKGVMIHTLSRYFLGPETQFGFVFGYGITDLPEIKYGLSILSRLLTAVMPIRRSRSETGEVHGARSHRPRFRSV
jgi:GntR family transcriptional regulator/MocR family aminotransferase